MPTFKYQGRDSNGNLVSGERAAQSSDNISEQLASEGVTPIYINEQKETEDVFNDIKKLFEKKRITTTELSLFTRQMYTLSKSGIPMSAAIKHLSQTSRSVRMAKVLLGVSERLESGLNLSAAMENYPDVFSPLIVAMVQIGQNTGQLDTAFLRLTEYLELEGSTLKRFKGAIRYPIFVLCAIIIGIIIINIFVIPVFSKIYKSANIPLPFVTTMLISMSDFIINYWIYISVVIIIVVIGIVQYIKSPEGKYRWHQSQLKIPILGDLLKRMILLRFAQTFAIIVNAGIPINDGLTLVSQAINNQYAREEIIGMKNAIQRGSGILQAASGCKLFTGLELQMLSISEETGELGSILNELALYYQREVEYDLKHLTDTIEPILLAIVAFMVLLLALAVYMPMWSMVKLVHK